MSKSIFCVLRQRLCCKGFGYRFTFTANTLVQRPDEPWQQISFIRANSSRSRSNIMRDKKRAIRTNVLEVIYGGRDNIPEEVTRKELAQPIEEEGLSEDEELGPGLKGSEIKQRAFLKESKGYERSSLDFINTLCLDSESSTKDTVHDFLTALADGSTREEMQRDHIKDIKCLCELPHSQRLLIMDLLKTEKLGEFLRRAMPSMETDTFVQSLLIFYWWELRLSASQNKVIEKECLQRISSWDVDTLLLVTDWWICMAGASSWSFHKEMLSVLRTSWTKLSAQQMVQAFYLCGQFKRPAQPVMDKLVLLAEGFVDELSLTEIAAVCNGMVKVACRLPRNSILPDVISSALSKDIQLESDIEKYNIVTIMRFLGRSYHYNADLYSKLAVSLVPYITDMHYLALPHILGVFARAAFLSKPLFLEVLRCFDHSKANLKDYYLTLWSYCKLNYTPDEFNRFLEVAIARIQENKEWMNDSPFLSVKTLVPLTFVGIYPVELIQRTFNPLYLKKIIGCCPPDVYKHLYCLDCSVAIECPDYTGPRLPNSILSRHNLVPHGSSKVVKDERQSYAEIIPILARVLGSEDAFLVHPILDHIRTPVDIEIHLDENNRPINLRDKKSTEGSITKLAVLVTLMNHYRKNSSELLGVHVMKRRQLKITGYHLVEIPFDEWHQVRGRNIDEKQKYLARKIFNR
nr:FAST kinase domain-containing protein 5, mitochondrial-like [Lytechinus pictus]